MKSKMRSIVCFILCFVVLTMTWFIGYQEAKAAALPLIIGGIAVGLVAIVGSLGITAIQQTQRTGAPIDWGMAWTDVMGNVERNATAIWDWAQTQDQAVRDALGSIPNVVINPTGDTNVDLTKEQFDSLTEGMKQVFPDGLPINAVETAAGNSFTTMSYNRYHNWGTTKIGGGTLFLTANVVNYEYDIAVVEKGVSGGTIKTYPSVVLHISNWKNVVFNSTSLYDSHDTAFLAVKGSPLDIYCSTHAAWPKNDTRNLSGYINSAGSKVSYKPENLINGEANTNVVFTAGSMVFNQMVGSMPRLHFSSTSAEGSTYFGNYGYLLTSVPTVNIVDTVKLDETQLAVIQNAWATAISQGQATAADALRFSVAQNMAELSTAITGSATQTIEATNAGTEAIVGAIAAAAAAAAAAAQPGELDLSRLTLGQTLMSRFPFCIPFDLINAFKTFNVGGTSAPVWHVAFEIGGVQVQQDIDLSQFNGLAAVLRWGILISFVIGLILVTRGLIKG